VMRKSSITRDVGLLLLLLLLLLLFWWWWWLMVFAVCCCGGGSVVRSSFASRRHKKDAGTPDVDPFVLSSSAGEDGVGKEGHSLV
jgi:hypothetical protein